MRRTAACLLALVLAAAVPLSAQVPGAVRGDSVQRARQQDSLRQARGDTALQDTSRGRGTGLPKAPSRTFPEPDSIIEALLARPGFHVTRYAADSVQLLAEDKEIRLAGQGLIERGGSTLEADTVRYTERNCGVQATGSPRLFDPTGVLVGTGMQYDACNHAGIVRKARTDWQYGGGTWILHGDMAVDNQEDRSYGANATITSCQLTDPHYHFATREVKWVNKRLMVARPAVLYVADVPVAWLPFVFQDTRHGRRSGILPPQFGINDIVRFNPGYQRHVSNVGYYWAISDYADAQVSMDWYASRYLSLNGRFRYRVLNRFLAGGIAFQELHESGGTSSRRISWSHQQQFSLASQLTANIDYATSSRVISRNAVDPVLAIGTIDSRLNYQRRFSGGTLNIGGSRTQSLDRPQVTATFPTIAFTPNPIRLSHAVTWSPSFSFSNSIQQHAGNAIAVATGPGTVDSLRTDSRQTQLNIATPLRLGSWNLNNSLSVSDQWSNVRSTAVDSNGVITTRGESFQTGIDWTTGVGLPILFQGRWNLQPGVNMVNTATGPFLLRNTYTQGRYVTNSKRFQFSLGVSPTLFGLFPGFGPVARIRHAISPLVSWAYAPAANIPLEYATALNRGQTPTTLVQPARQTISFGLSQIFEAKLHVPRAPGDSAAAAAAEDSAAANPDAPAPEGRKLKLLSIQSDAVSYDFEQAKLPGRTGWTTQTWGNTLSSDLVRGFSLRIAHDLWEGPVGYSTSHFRPVLTSVATGFSIGAGTLNLFRRFLGLAPQHIAEVPPDTANQASPTNPGRNFTNAFQRGPLATNYTAIDRLTPSRGGQRFSAQFSYSLQRQRRITPATATEPATTTTTTTNSMLSGSVQFSPTAHWTLSWQTSYNFTQGSFSEQVVRLDRDLHDWRATFTFVKSPNGNFLFNFFLQLIDEPDLKIGYDQRNVR